MNKLNNYIREIEDPSNYLDGISSEYTYTPEKLVFFSRLKPSEFVNNLPIIHYRFNLVFSLKGSLQIHIDNHLLTVNEGESLLISPYQSHYYVSGEDKDLLWLFIGFDMKERRGLEKLRNNPVVIEPFVRVCLEKMISAGDNLKISLLSAIITTNKEKTDSNKKTTDFLRKQIIEESIVHTVQNFLYSDLSQTISTSMLAAELGISESSLHKQFKKAIGISPGRYIREVKINYACSILESGANTITETASLCGFESVYSFSRSFKKVTGFSPSGFKNRNMET